MYLASTHSICDGNRDRCLVDIQSDKHGILYMVAPSFLRLGTGQSDATLDRRMPKESSTHFMRGLMDLMESFRQPARRSIGN